MGVSKFRSVAEMPDPPRATSALAGLAAACELSELSRAFGHDTTRPRGVFKFRSVADASEDREAWEDAVMRRRAERSR